jgi:hypothetical protein
LTFAIHCHVAIEGGPHLCVALDGQARVSTREQGPDRIAVIIARARTDVDRKVVQVLRCDELGEQLLEVQATGWPAHLRFGRVLLDRERIEEGKMAHPAAAAGTRGKLDLE